MTHGLKTFTDNWNEFRLTATESNYDDKAMQRLLLKGFKRVILDAWAQDHRQVDDVDGLAQWAMEKKNQINFIKSLHKTPTISRTDSTLQNPNATYRLMNNNNQEYGDPMDLDATRRQPRLNISREEFQRRMRERLCLKCGKARTPGCEMQDHTKAIRRTSTTLAAKQEASLLASKTTDQRRRHRFGTRAVRKQRMSPVRDGLRDRPERKPIITANDDAALNYTETRENDKDHIMVKLQLNRDKEIVNINAMLDSGATEDFMDKEVCKKHGIKMIEAEVEWKIYLADGKLSAMGPVAHMAKVSMDISNHRELATFQVANLQHHQVILGMLWLRGHKQTIDWNKRKITFNSERYTTECLPVRLLHMRYLKQKPWKRILSPDSPRSRPKKTRASKSRSYHQRPGCLPKVQSRLQGTTCTQAKEQRFPLEDKSQLEPE